MTKCFFGIGGGSDFHSACLLAESENDVVLTALAPVVRSGVIDLQQTIRKYTGQTYSIDDDGNMKQSPQYASYAVINGDVEWPVFADSRRTLAYGILVVSKKHASGFAMCVASLKSIMCGCSATIAVDTGGDCLRGRLDGMGDIDISNLFDGIVDSRDVDSIDVIGEMSGYPMRVFVLGPGCDGETSREGLAVASASLKTNKLPARCQLVKEGNMSEFADRFSKVHGWSNPASGSTISNIQRSLTGSDPLEEMTIERRGTVASRVPAGFVRRYWILDLYSTDSIH